MIVTRVIVIVKLLWLWLRQPEKITAATAGKDDKSCKSAEDDSIEEEGGEPISKDIGHQSTNQIGMFYNPIQRSEPNWLKVMDLESRI